MFVHISETDPHDIEKHNMYHRHGNTREVSAIDVRVTAGNNELHIQIGATSTMEHFARWTTELTRMRTPMCRSETERVLATRVVNGDFAKVGGDEPSIGAAIWLALFHNEVVSGPINLKFHGVTFDATVYH